ncbi:MAG TPA: CPBP family intramembrane glutamic endopeptidase [Natronosporangium sp.]|nr:CPBP family intramembrane glutamic endopeptidase [Natronosporangium sp.]
MTTTAPPAAPPRSVLRNEVLLVLGVSLGASALMSVLRIAERLTRGTALSEQTAALNVSQLPDRPWFDLTHQLLRISLAVVPVLLVLYLLNRYPGGGTRLIGLDLRRPRFDLGTGLVLTAVIGVPGLALYVAALHFGFGVRIVPAALAAAWWTVPVLILAAAQNALLEEVVGVGYLFQRLRELGWGIPAVLTAHALLRGSYHLYQGFGGFLGNAAMGVVFGLFYLRYRRVMPLVVAHTLLDVVAFVGYSLFQEELDALLASVLAALPGR